MLSLFLYLGGLKVAKYDVYHIEERLKSWNPNVVRIDWDADREVHKIICQDAFKKEYVGMTVPFGKLDARVIHRMMEINPERGYNPFNELDDWFNKKDREDDHKMAEMAYGMADVLRKPLLNDALYGR